MSLPRIEKNETNQASIEHDSVEKGVQNIKDS